MSSFFHAWSLFALDLVLLWVLLRARGRLLNAKNADPQGWKYRSLNMVATTLFAGAMLGVAPIGWYVCADGWPARPTAGPLAGLGTNAWAAVWYLVAVQLPAAICYLFVWWGEYRFVRRSAPQGRRREHVLTALVVMLLGGMIAGSGVLLLPGSPPAIDMMATVSILVSTVLLIAISSRLSAGAMKPTDGAADELALTPLGHELSEVTARFTRGAHPWTMTTLSRRSTLTPERKRAVVFATWWQHFRLRRPRIPESIVRELDHPSIVALAALQYARASTPLAERRHERFDGRRVGRIALSILSLLIPMVFSLVATLMYTSAGYGMRDLLLLAVCGIVLWSLTLRRLARPGPEVYDGAYRVWCAAQGRPDAAESVVGFFMALSACDALIQHELNRRQIARLHLSNRGLELFVARRGPEAMAMVRAALEEWVAAEPEAGGDPAEGRAAAPGDDDPPPTDAPPTGDR